MHGPVLLAAGLYRVLTQQVRLQDGDARAEANNPETPAARQPMQDMPDYIELERAWAGTPGQKP